MENIFLQDDILLVESKIRDFEDRTGCELLVVVTDIHLESYFQYLF